MYMSAFEMQLLHCAGQHLKCKIHYYTIYQVSKLIHSSILLRRDRGEHRRSRDHKTMKHTAFPWAQ